MDWKYLHGTIVIGILLISLLSAGKVSAATPSPSVSVPPGNTSVSVALLLHGIGKGGDNVAPGITGNTSPQHPQRNLTFELYNASNQLALTTQATLTYQQAAGNFTATVDLGTTGSGNYTARVKVPQYLARQAPGILVLTAGAAKQLQQFSLVSGDVNNDNTLSILDYNLILDCFSDLSPARNCSDQTKKLMTDLTDDGSVNQFDYNLFLRELSVQCGDACPEPTTTIMPTDTPTPTGTTPVPTTPPGQVVGYGKNTVGGTGGTVTNVSTLAALNTCVAGAGKRICKITGSSIFDGKGGTVNIVHPNITIDGTGSSVIFKDVWIQVKASEVILRNIRVRTGDLNVLAADADAISINGGSTGINNIVIDHVEAAWGPDVVFTILNNVSDITVQHSIIASGLTKSAHPEALQDIDGHNLSFNISGLSANTYPKRVTVYKNLITNSQGRHTRAQGSEAVDIINNIYYNYDEAPQGNPRSLNFVGNILRWGPAPQSAGLGDPEKEIYRPVTSADFPNFFINAVYESNNVADGFTGAFRGSPANVYRSSPAVPFSVTPDQTTGLLEKILTAVGPDVRDAVTNQWISDVRNKTGKYFNGAGFPPPNPHWP